MSWFHYVKYLDMSNWNCCLIHSILQRMSTEGSCWARGGHEGTELAAVRIRGVGDSKWDIMCVCVCVCVSLSVRVALFHRISLSKALTSFSHWEGPISFLYFTSLPPRIGRDVELKELIGCVLLIELFKKHLRWLGATLVSVKSEPFRTEDKNHNLKQWNYTFHMILETH